MLPVTVSVYVLAGLPGFGGGLDHFEPGGERIPSAGRIACQRPLSFPRTPVPAVDGSRGGLHIPAFPAGV